MTEISMHSKYSVGSLFAGIGGICIAFKKAGCEIVWANEWDEKACKTYQDYFKEKSNIIEDNIVNHTNPVDFEYADIITSGFPCQAFSVAGYRQGFNDEKGRGNLFFQTAKVIDEIKPKAFLLENVKNLYGHDGGRTFKIIKHVITEQLEYSFIPFILNSKDYGNIPQTRERVYIVGFKDEREFACQLNKEPEQNLFNAEYDTSKIASLHFKIPSPVKLDKTIHDIIIKEQQPDKYYYKPDHQYYPELSEKMTKRDTIYQWRRVYVRENKNNVCPTLTANMGTGGHNVPLIIDDFGIRKLTPKECLRFQGFPEKFNFPDDMANSHCYKQAGNSVVVPVVKRIADAIVKALDIKYENSTVNSAQRNKKK